MSGVLPQNRIAKGTYKLIIEYLNCKEYEVIAENELSFIDKQTEYGLMAKVNQIKGIPSDQIQLIENETNRSIKVKYSNSSELKNMKLKVKTLERTGEF